MGKLTKVLGGLGIASLVGVGVSCMLMNHSWGFLCGSLMILIAGIWMAVSASDYIVPLGFVVGTTILTLVGYFLGGLVWAFVSFVLSMVFFGIPLALWFNEKVGPPIDFHITAENKFPYFVYFIEVWVKWESDYWKNNESVIIKQIRAEIADTPLDCDVKPQLPFAIKRDTGSGVYFAVVCREIPTSITIETNENEYYEPLGCVNCALQG